MVDTKSRQATGKALAARDALRDSFGVWTHVSVAGIGGPAKQIATMHRLAVEGKRWISEDGFFHALSYCIALPGPETQQLAIYVGWLANRTIGGIIAGGLFILPGAICMMALSFGYVLGAELQAGQAIFVGVRPAILAIMAEAIVRFGRHVLHGPLMLAVAALAFLAAFFKLPLPLIIFVPALLGIAAAMARLPGFTRPAAATTDRAAGAHKREGLADHARPGIAQLARSLAIWLALWLAPAITLFAIFGMDNIYTQISLAFGKVALMAFGGDYAVVVYGAKQAVDSYHWISTREVQEGIAMGEIVPGTIMIVTQFFGFVAAYRDPGNLPPLLAGVFGGLLATWMTFIPCFLWILSIAPFIEGLRRKAISQQRPAGRHRRRRRRDLQPHGLVRHSDLVPRGPTGPIRPAQLRCTRFRELRPVGIGAVCLRRDCGVPFPDQRRHDSRRIIGGRHFASMGWPRRVTRYAGAARCASSPYSPCF